MLPTNVNPADRVTLALSILGSATGRPASRVLDEIELALRGATLDEIAATRTEGERG